MAIKFRLPEDTRNKYDLPEWVTYDPDTLMLDEAIHLEDTLGIDPFELVERLSPGKKRDMRAWKYVIWLAATRAGADVSYEEFNLDLFALRAASDVPEDAGPKETPADAPSIPENSSGDATEPSES